MGIVDPKRYDSFLSYAHDDNVEHGDAVSLFRSYLKPRFTIEVGRRLNRPRQVEAEIFMDRSGMPANGDLRDELVKAVQRSFFLVIFIGRWYPESDWCGQELDVFTRQFRGNRTEALKRTFVLVLERRAVSKEWGDYLEIPERPICEEFYDDQRGDIIPFVLEDPDGRAVPSPRFLRRLSRVVGTMADRAHDLRG